MGFLTHGCIGEPLNLNLNFEHERPTEADPEALDVMTSRSSTLPYDDDKMQKMIELVQKAKRTSRSGYDTGLTDCVTQRYRRAWMMWVAWNTTTQRPVSVRHTLASFNTHIVL